MAQYSKYSLYNRTPQGSSSLGILNYTPIPKVDSDVEYTVLAQYTYRPDLLASDLYNDPELFWVFKSRNPSVIDDPIFDFVPGITIKIPTINTIQRVLGGV